MAVVNGEVEFTQLVRLNVTDILLLRGVPVGGITSMQITEVIANYQVAKEDDIVVCTGTFNITLPLLANANKQVSIKSITGTITVGGNGSSVETPVSLTPGQASSYVPTSTGWIQV